MSDRCFELFQVTITLNFRPLDVRFSICDCLSHRRFNRQRKKKVRYISNVAAECIFTKFISDEDSQSCEPEILVSRSQLSPTP